MDTDLILAIVVYAGIILFVAWDAVLRCRSLWWVPLPVLLATLTGPVGLAVWLAVRPAERRGAGGRWMAPAIGVAILTLFLLAGWQYSELIAKDLAAGKPVQTNWVVALFVIPLGPRGAVLALGLLGLLLASPFLAPLVLGFNGGAEGSDKDRPSGDRRIGGEG
jgi:hypothetical protein